MNATATRKIRHLSFGLTVAAAALGAPAAAWAQQVILKVHHFLPSTSSAQLKLIQPWCDKVAKESGDRLKCQIYPAMQLGGTPAQLFEQARDGVADIVWTVPTYAAGRFTKSEVFELPWMAATAKSGSQALWTYVDRHAADEFKGVKRIFMHVHDGALFHFSGKQPKTLEDLKGLKVRAATRANSRMLAALGAAPVQMPLPAVPESLSKGVVDGATVPWEGTPSIKLAEIAKYHLDVPAGAPRISNTIFLFGMNQAKYDSLPADLKRVIDANSGLAASAWAGETGFDAVVETYKKAAKDAGGVFYNLPEAEYQRWVKATDSVDDDWVKDASAKGADGKKLLAEARSLVQQYAK
ncbi:TRAP transporter substrate-binding protein [Ideonella livida]|uniref:TRAP transporter substrate-binding protein n=1 Tax=Ideonella livida TaxID=2707176 RepID=A0A7C9PKG7_9BURK|nr:TRAP transporter substrate-binding protein [Ideonella livida]NDY93471.1 TRAP transporter substrate-binding protein [Ideonella livida]